MSHTPTPWNVVVKDKIFIYGGNNKLVAHVCEPADAMYLADAVLNHDRLTAEVGRLREALTLVHNGIKAKRIKCSPVISFGPETAELQTVEEIVAKALNPEEPK